MAEQQPMPTSSAQPATGNRARVQRYRAKHRRIDYVPSPDVLAIIDLHLDARLDNCVAGVIDKLIEAGHRAMSGNGNRGLCDHAGGQPSALN